MKIKKAQLTDFIPDENNANKGTVRGQKMLQESLREDGAARSIVVDANNNVVAGNKTLENAVDIGIENAVVVETTGEELVITKRTDWDLYEDEAPRRYAYRDNRSSEVGLDWAPDIVLADIKEGVDLSSLFYDNELSDILNKVETPPGEDEPPPVDKAEELQKKWGTEVGQVWGLGKHRLICGDCTDRGVVERVMGGERAEILFEDPPYGIKQDGGFEGFGGFGPPIARRQYKDDWDSNRPSKETFSLHLKQADNALIFGGNFFADILPLSTHWIVWDKLNTMPTFGDCELIWTTFNRKSVKKIVFEYNGLLGKEKDRFHPTQKPVGLFDKILGEYSNVGSIVFDGYLGSGTTIMSCENLNRQCRAIEIDLGYVGVCLQRFFDHTGVEPVLLSDGNS